ncbi:MAG TPA: helix-turn-helix transcriptional regulator [Chthoniobacteraceae bacterium]|nr:helix-turn-helix transcriptional regulator [Chthoniobacteraceae bacterium]
MSDLHEPKATHGLIKYRTMMVVVIDHAETSKHAKTIREKAGLSIREVARRMSVRPKHISDLEAGNRLWSRSKAILFENALKRGRNQTKKSKA